MSVASECLAELSLPDLPILDLLPELTEAFESAADTLILQAAPGAGKTTVLPLLALKLDVFKEQKIIVLEPRRLATKAAAERMSALLGEPVGQTVGYRVRMESRVSKRTRIEVMTEGLFLRRLQNDPELEGVALVIFDEMHERHLDGDLALALTLQSRDIFREESPLKILLMSATLQSEQLKVCFPDAPLVRSEGRQYPVEVEYQGQLSLFGCYRQEMADRLKKALHIALKKMPGSVLIFLPGQGEIKFCLEYLQEQFAQWEDETNNKLFFSPLYGDLPLEKQFEAISPAKDGLRKVVLATDIAESSLTIEGVTVVIDGGLKRRSAFDPNTGMNRLLTERCSKASSKQRAGRAGRVQDGYCLRLWSQTEQESLADHGQAEILRADLSPLCLQAAAWGAECLDELQWLDVPPVANTRQACDLLESLGAFHASQGHATRGHFPSMQISKHGELLLQLPMHPRLAHMLSLASGNQDLATKIAALLVEKDPLGQHAGSCDIELRLQWLAGESDSKHNQGARHRIRSSVKQMTQQLRQQEAALDSNEEEPRAVSSVAGLLLLAYPDRLAKRLRQHSDGQYIYQLSNGRQATLDASDPLSREEFLLAAQIGGRKGQQYDRIHLAAAADRASIEASCKAQFKTQAYINWDKQEGRFLAEERVYLGRLLLEKKALKSVEPDVKSSALMNYIRENHQDCLVIDKNCQQLIERINWLHRLEIDKNHLHIQWPDILDRLEGVLAPELARINKLAELKNLNLKNSILALLSWEEQQYLDKHLPVSISVPSGAQKSLDYQSESAVLAVKLQEMFGCSESPKLLNGKLPISLQLLSPAGRPLAVTQDLSSFWQNAYQDVKKEMKGRYPKHPWPDDPLQAPATSKTKAALARSGERSK
ncbi:ATP-dependent helicase HrpB [Pseudoteredinibacter isoporae]|uniref:ATP-dependent helicase HrpB n=1 Tax=Pseudoteredinibacter isoporae TaxID=570281 RepID=A0A7X0MWW4_9GAMM|nr:ATP-dependent helicase HrpB [Pseudoteredinibacter isoporae]MBB6523096.1 ATP-dependent helicase HrpB [Pseudoteredinibacter isoporae]NHO88616.1 ATP-dependent helicase HrpB [Pseudoteredinibacter isoporae]NIB22693.1 ATP-dependent helicase HrpB [Pseudoteredinibacter isoporae]